MAENLTHRRLIGLRAEGARIEIRDSVVPNLVLRVQPGTDAKPEGTKSWSVQFRRKGFEKKQRLTLGPFPAVSISRARERAKEALETAAEGRDPIAEMKARADAEIRASLSFSDLLDEYLDLRRGVASMTEVERELRKDAVPVLGKLRPADITAADIDIVIQAILNRGSPAMGRRMITLIKAMFNFLLMDAPSLAAKYGISSNPAAYLGRRRRGSKSALVAPKARSRFLSDDEIPRWWAALDQSDMLPDRKLALKIILVTGQRPGEVRNCKKKGLRLDGTEPMWTLSASETKPGRAHLVPLSPLAVRLFQEAIALSGPSAFVFPDADADRAGAPISKVVLPSAQVTLFRNHLAQMEPATAHDLRRSAATGMRRLGVAPHVVGMILNHARGDVTGKHYDWHDGLSERRDALDLWAAWLEKINGPRGTVLPFRMPA